MSKNDAVVEALIAQVKIRELAATLGLDVTERQGSAKALCPFHSDTSPSMVLYDDLASGDRSHFHCYACGKHGDIFHLVQEKLSKTFPEAVIWLAGKYGIPMERGDRADVAKRSVEPKVGVRSEGLRQALRIYASDLNFDEDVVDLAKSRQFDREFLIAMEVAIARPNVLKQKALQPGERKLLADLEAAGLLSDKFDRTPEGGSYHLRLSLWREFFYDKRAIFPVRDEKSSLVGLIGRAFTQGNNLSSPKYLYSPGFKKGDNLYRVESAFSRLRNASKGLRREKQRANRKVDFYIVEGLFDALRLESDGHAAVAILGADLSTQQTDTIAKFSQALNEEFAVSLHCHIFLDCDEAGLRGTAKALRLLLGRNVEVDSIWPIGLSGKDPDEICIQAGPGFDLLAMRHPPALALLADSLGTSPPDILRMSSWDDISPQRLRASSERLIREVSKIVGAAGPAEGRTLALNLICRRTGNQDPCEGWWIAQIKTFAVTDLPKSHGFDGLYIQDDIARLDYARKLAWSSIQRGELPVDELAWRRIDRVASLFNRGLVERLADKNEVQSAPFDTIYVPRGFDDDEHRPKSLPAPEDLVLQQYVLAELLSERLGTEFSNAIPAVRYFARASETVTTGESARDREPETLSFAYQIDMDVLEGWSTPKDSGIFRHYWDCWQEFISALRARTALFSDEVYSVRLDLKRYYDNVKRGWVRDVLIPRVQAALDLSEVAERFAPLLQRGSSSSPGELAPAVVDWLLSQSFGYSFFEPDTGVEKNSPADVGLPQGPDLSAYLATVALFPIDGAMRAILDQMNVGGASPRAVYVRYVDDIILAADSEEGLTRLRRSLEDALRGTNLLAVNKHGAVRPMSREAFSDSLTNHRAFTASMPTPGFSLSPDGDGAAYFEGGGPENRSDALIVLNDPRLYFASRTSVLQAIASALSVDGELRHNEFVKAARWLWYLLAETEPDNVQTARATFFELWNETFGKTKLWGANDVKDRPWSDPAAYAIEGLDRLLSDKFLNWFRFTDNEIQTIARRLSYLSTLVSNATIHHLFSGTDSTQAPTGWGQGLPTHLKRMFIQRLSAIRGKAFLLLGSQKFPHWDLAPEYYRSIDSASLRQFEVNVIEYSGHDLLTAGSRTRSLDTWGGAFSIVHESIARLGSSEHTDEDPLRSVSEVVHSSRERAKTDVMVAPLRLWFAELGTKGAANPNEDLNDAEIEVFELALNTFVNATPPNLLPALLSHRFHLLRHICGTDDTVRPIPMIGTAKRQIGAPFLYVFCGETKLCALTYVNEPPSLPPLFDGNWIELPNISARFCRWEIETGSLTQPKNLMAAPLSMTSADVRAMGKMAWSLIKNSWASQDTVDAVHTFEVPITAAHIFKRADGQHSWEIIGSPVSASSLGNKAYIRDGTAGLRMVSVPLEDAWLWRIGVAMTDYLGFADDLDHFSPLPRALEQPTGEYTEPVPAWHLMRETLFRLRGEFAAKRPGTDREDKSIVPASIVRLLEQLAHFPLDDVQNARQQQLAYLLSAMAETEAMRLRLSETRDFEIAGVIPAFLEKMTRNIVNFKLKPQWDVWLPGPHDFPVSLRRPLSAFRSLASRIIGLTPPVTDRTRDGLSWQSLVVGFDVATASLALRLSVLDIAVICVDDNFGDETSDWSNPGYFHPGANNRSRNLAADLKKIQAGQAAGEIIDGIAPMGWLILLETMLLSIPKRGIVLENDAFLTKLPTLLGRITIVKAKLAPSVEHQEDETRWPFDMGVTNWVSLRTADPVSLVSQVFELLSDVDTLLSIHITTKVESTFPLRDRAYGGTHHLPRWRMQNFGGGTQRESTRTGESSRFVWTEVWREDRLLSVVSASARLARLARLSVLEDDKPVAITDVENERSISPIDSSPNHISPPHKSHTDSARGETAALDADHSSSNPLSQTHADAGGEPTTVNPKLGQIEKIVFTSTPQQSRNLKQPFLLQQWAAWGDRAERNNPQHVRVAILQLEVNDSYRHPLVDAGVPASIWKEFADMPLQGTEYEPVKARRGNEHTLGDDDLIAEVKPSWSEHRRQVIIRHTLQACAKFKVDVLVLPEYSVRPETIVRIRELLDEIEGAPAVYAGTYRMFGSKAATRNLEQLGLQDSKYLDSQAILSLVEPKKGNQPVQVTTRPKRYPSTAAKEFFSPSSHVQSLFLPRKAKIEAGFDPLSVFVELICSELFIATSPSNLFYLAAEYGSLLNRFGIKMIRNDVLNRVRDDIEEYANRTSLNRGREFWPRRSILVVPAMTSRSADYWIFGQSALLASGMTTVFCNAVLGKSSVGGSCFIGRASWTQQDGVAGLLAPTPYHGWSHGIYYSQRTDPLSEFEQALLIADIDPVHMIEGKPRPQSLSDPLQLVAHIPIIETLRASRMRIEESSIFSYERVSEIVSAIEENVAALNSETTHKLHHGTSKLSTKLDKLANFTADPGPFKARTNVWRRDAPEQPYCGTRPPSLVDWLWIDLTPRMKDGKPTLPKILVPHWTAGSDEPRDID